MTEAAKTVPTLYAWCRDLQTLAVKMGFQISAKYAPIVGRAANNNNNDKTPTPAPSPELLQMLLSELPNDQGYFDYRGKGSKWVDAVHAIAGAARAGRCAPLGREWFLAWCDTWDGAVDRQENARVWDTLREVHTGWGTLMKILHDVNPAGWQRVRDAELAHAFNSIAIANQQALSAVPLAPVAAMPPASIPPREWLYGRTVLAGYPTAVVAPGGAGKSAYAMTMALSMALGRSLLPGEAPHRALHVLYFNAEDDMREQSRRYAATIDLHNAQHSSLGGRLFLASGRDLPLKLARMGKDGPEEVPGMVDWLIDQLKAHKIDVLFLDPLGALHSLPENSNEAVNFLAGIIRRIAQEAGVAIVILHHTSKAAAMDMDAAGAGAARGASALVDAMRIVIQMRPMNGQEAAKLGIPEIDRRRYIRIDNGKANFAPLEEARWVRMVPVNLNNGTPDYPHGDSVGAIEGWTLPAAAGGTVTDLAAVQAAISAAQNPPRKDRRSPEWVGWIVARALGLDTGTPAQSAKSRTATQAGNLARIGFMLDGWLASGALVEIEGRNDSRHPVPCVGVGTPAILSDDLPAVPDTADGGQDQ